MTSNSQLNKQEANKRLVFACARIRHGLSCSHSHLHSGSLKYVSPLWIHFVHLEDVIYIVKCKLSQQMN